MTTTPHSPVDLPADFTLRHDLQPGDLGNILHLHGIYRARECGFDPTFEADVARCLAAFAQEHGDRDRLWIAERGRQLVGCLAVVGLSPKDAQLRWFLVDPSAEGLGLDERLLGEARAFCEQCEYEYVFFWEMHAGQARSELYQSFGFEKVQHKVGSGGGVEVIEERYVWHPVGVSRLVGAPYQPAYAGRSPSVGEALPTSNP